MQFPTSQTRFAPRAWLEARRFHSGDECLNWPFSVGGGGYGLMHVSDGKRVAASRVMCQLAHGPAPSAAHQAAHSCGNTLCVNPRHIRWATATENMADRAKHGTEPSGEKHYRSNLTVEDVAEMRRRRAEGATIAELGASYGLSRQGVQDIVSGRNWAEGKKHRLGDAESHREVVRRAKGGVARKDEPVEAWPDPVNLKFAHEVVSAAVAYQVRRRGGGRQHL